MMQISSLQASEFDAAYALFNEITSTNWTYSLFMQTVIKGHSVVARQNGDIVGYCLCTAVLDELNIEDISVHESVRKQGLGKQMISAIIDIANKEFINSLFLEVRRSNKAARALYRSLGFEMVGERKNYYPAYKGAQREDALVLKYYIS